MYHYQSPPDDPRNYRLQPEAGRIGWRNFDPERCHDLAFKPDSRGLCLLSGKKYTGRRCRQANVYPLPRQPEQASQDYKDLSDRIQILVETPDLDPVTFLDFERQERSAAI